MNSLPSSFSKFRNYLDGSHESKQAYYRVFPNGFKIGGWVKHAEITHTHCALMCQFCENHNSCLYSMSQLSGCTKDLL